MSQGQRRGHAPLTGLGVIKCGHCGQPTRDHSLLELCPELARVLGHTKLTAPSPLAAGKEKLRAESRS